MYIYLLYYLYLLYENYSSQCWVGMHQRQGKKSERKEEKGPRHIGWNTQNHTRQLMCSKGMKSREQKERNREQVPNPATQDHSVTSYDVQGSYGETSFYPPAHRGVYIMCVCVLCLTFILWSGPYIDHISVDAVLTNGWEELNAYLNVGKEWNLVKKDDTYVIKDRRIFKKGKH